MPGCGVGPPLAGVSNGLVMSALEKIVFLCLFGYLVGQIVQSVYKLSKNKLGVIMAKTTEMQQELPSVTVCAFLDDESDMNMIEFSEIKRVEDAIISLTYPHLDGITSVLYPS